MVVCLESDSRLLVPSELGMARWQSRICAPLKSVVFPPAGRVRASPETLAIMAPDGRNVTSEPAPDAFELCACMKCTPTRYPSVSKFMNEERKKFGKLA